MWEPWNEKNLDEPENVFQEPKFDIQGIPEVRRKEEEIRETKNGNITCHIRNNEEQREVSFLIEKKCKKFLEEFKGVNDRIVSIKSKIGN